MKKLTNSYQTPQKTLPTNYKNCNADAADGGLSTLLLAPTCDTRLNFTAHEWAACSNHALLPIVEDTRLWCAVTTLILTSNSIPKGLIPFLITIGAVVAICTFLIDVSASRPRLITNNVIILLGFPDIKATDRVNIMQ